jgi:hypothetical protein
MRARRKRCLRRRVPAMSPCSSTAMTARASCAHLESLCKRHGMPPPPAGATHLRASLGALRLKWERHGEFSGYLIIAPGAASRPFGEPAATLMPADWLSVGAGAHHRRGARGHRRRRAWHATPRRWPSISVAMRWSARALPKARVRCSPISASTPTASRAGWCWIEGLTQGQAGRTRAAAGGDRGLPAAGAAGLADCAPADAAHACHRARAGAAHRRPGAGAGR